LFCGSSPESVISVKQATAKLNQIPRVLSEDFQRGRRIEGVKFLNPFKTNLFTKE
jgi:predicted nucleic acid-binding protein